jgi:hypothetical protein
MTKSWLAKSFSQRAGTDIPRRGTEFAENIAPAYNSLRSLRLCEGDFYLVFFVPALPGTNRKTTVHSEPNRTSEFGFSGRPDSARYRFQ